MFDPHGRGSGFAPNHPTIRDQLQETRVVKLRRPDYRYFDVCSGLQIAFSREADSLAADIQDLPDSRAGFAGQTLVSDILPNAKSLPGPSLGTVASVFPS